MNTLTLETNLHCKKCIDKIKPLLDEDPVIHNWEVDLEQELKILKVSGQNLNAAYINQLLETEGYAVLGRKSAISFWKDRSKWKRACFNTWNCLMGCSVGDFGMVIFLQAFYPETSVAWQMMLAVLAGLCTSIVLETTLLKYREHFNWSYAFKTALGMSFISMVAMEIAMTGTDFIITGGKAAFSDVVYWLALLPALVAGFITPLPYNYYRLKKLNKACH